MMPEVVPAVRGGGRALRELVAAAAQRLEAAGVPSPRHDAEALAAHLLGVSRGELSLHPHADGEFAQRYNGAVDRRAAREPLQHITGAAPFRHLTVRVGPGVFVPRPETELTAGAAIAAARAVAAAGRVPILVELFAGAGPIALSAAHEVPGAVVHAVESDPEAMTWLRRNVEDSSVVAHHADVADSVEGCLRAVAGAVDVVAANPPYVPIGARIRDPEVIAHDPPPALWSGPDGLDAMRELARVAARLLRPGGTVVAEHADVQALSGATVFTGDPAWAEVADHIDLAGRPRYLTAVRAGD